jgi:hypothetical protein
MHASRVGGVCQQGTCMCAARTAQGHDGSHVHMPARAGSCRDGVCLTYAGFLVGCTDMMYTCCCWLQPQLWLNKSEQHVCSAGCSMAWQPGVRPPIGDYLYRTAAAVSVGTGWCTGLRP